MKKPRHFAFLVFCTLLWSTPLWAAHIIGGEITYVCNGNGSYKFTMKIYRDCFGGGAPFDSGPGAPFPGTVTVFAGTSNIPYSATIQLGAPVITNILPNLSNPCLIAPPNVCVEEGIYTFTIDLPQSPESYHIVYQRCCRNNSISNLINPGETGATYWMELTAKAQQVCNSSPTFNDFPPIVICAGEPINYDHSANDAEGDQLVYELCAPLRGGGTDQGNPFAPTGVAPDPDLPPGYSPVTFIGPIYSWSNPLVGNPPLSINSSTGFITGVPTVQGQFVVGVCVKEYRNGDLLSITRRDFQFNVAECDPTVVADIEEDEMVNQQGQQLFVVNGCGNFVEFTNQSYQAQFINSFRWEFDINGTLETINDWNASVNFPAPGVYFGQLLLNPGTSCGDTAHIQVNVFPDITSDFEFIYDTCVAGPVAFTDLSYTGAGPDAISLWEWDFGDGVFSSQEDPQHIYQIPGNIPVTLRVEDTNGCIATKTRTVPYFPVPQFLVVAPSEYIGCQPASIFFNNLSVPVDSNYTVNWNFGDGSTGNGISPTHVYNDLGVFTVSLEIISPLGCQTDTIWPDLITVLPSPVAGFSFSPERPSNLEPTVQFTDESMDAVKWKWSFGNSGTSVEQNPVFTFPDTGMQVIQQVVFHESGCPDTALQLLDIIPEVRYHLPNAFTPNGDGVNDLFGGAGMMEGSTNFNLSIWNRYGEKIFETTDPFERWNGRKNNTGDLATQGVYVVLVSFKSPRGELVKIKG
ncbi:MAG: PKD domain-containing protein, partial [Saprospiraceae bacterium]